MDKSNNLSVNINIGGRTYPLSIKREEEEGLRRIAKEIEEHISHLRDNYAVKDVQDLLAMTLLEYASRLESQDQAKGERVAGEMLADLDILLDDLKS